MGDPWVQQTQMWINETYRFVADIPTVTVDGQTRWEVMYALTRALQYEIGITSLSDTFGSGTLGALEDIGNIGPSTSAAAIPGSRANVFNIVRGATYCKGYNGGNGVLDGTYSALTTSAIQEMRQDIGLDAGDGSVSPKVFKALLTMDAYVLLDEGSSEVRAIQRNLNSRYLDREDFFVIPTDGYYSRGVAEALMYAIQYEEGLVDGTANGNFGPTTKSRLQTMANLSQGSSDSSSGKWFVHLFQAALTFNGYPTAYDGVFSATTKTVTQQFQQFVALPITGTANIQTWASLLVSTGDVDRPGTAADSATTITAARAAKLVSKGYQTVGRYLTNSPVADPLDKNIKPGELATIFSNGMSVFPIFQEGGDYLEYFDYEKGLYAGAKAHDAATGYGFRRGTTIYFAVDFDALEEDVRSNVVPYFQGIRRSIAQHGSRYNVGVYGARNTCSIVSEEGLASLSFVSDMSTGYSGNLGFKLPTNWAFDQVLETSIGSGNGYIDIDKDIKSGRDNGQTSVVAAPGAGVLDVRTPTSVLDVQAVDVAAWLSDTMNDYQRLGAERTREETAALVQSYDELITNLARGYGMRKSLIQTALAWEAGVENVVQDAPVDALVIATYASMFEGAPIPQTPLDDCSTGVCQIYARTAINAINWGRNRNLTILPARDASEPADVWEIWQSLHNDEEFNITMCALVLLHAAFNAGVTNDWLSLTQPEIESTLGKYNGDHDYGVANYPLYAIFESYNQTARSGPYS